MRLAMLECRECQKTRVLDAANGFVNISKAKGWVYRTDAGWLCPDHKKAPGDEAEGQ